MNTREKMQELYQHLIKAKEILTDLEDEVEYFQLDKLITQGNQFNSKVELTILDEVNIDHDELTLVQISLMVETHYKGFASKLKEIIYE